MDQAEALLFEWTQSVKEPVMDENSKGKIHIYKAGPRGAAVQEDARQLIKSTMASSSRTLAAPSRPLRLETNETPDTKNS